MDTAAREVVDASARYAALFVGREKTPDAFWTSLRYFNLYRIAVAALFLMLTVIYGDALNLGSHQLDFFRIVAAAYLVLGIVLHAVLRNLRDYFNEQLTLHAGLDVLAITLLMYASGGIRSGLGVMLLISLTGAAIVAPRRLNLLYASIATIALLLEHGYWVLVHDAPEASYLQPGLLAIGCFATASVTGWLSQRVAANERLARQRGRELATQTRVSQLVIADMQDGVAVIDREGRIVQHNPQAQRLLATPSLIGTDIRELLPGFAPSWAAWRSRGLPRGAAGEVGVHGREIGLRLLETGTEEEYSLLFIEDTTRSREQAQQLKLAALGRLTANIAHEIRNPLSAISHATELLDEEKRGEDRERLTRIIRDNTQRLDRLVNDVLQLNRRDRVAGEPLRLRAWLDGFLAEFIANERAPAGRIVLEAGQAGAPEVVVRFDREHLRQVMWNLLRNAVRYARAEPGAVRIAVRVFGDTVELGVMDNGPGVPPSSQGQLFEPFFTTDSKGTGLGLYLARELCSANGAQLEYVKDRPGAHFRIVMRQGTRA
ncbi:MAG TPA: ATP-binding protein [Burkholderiales bacterium]|nr:ATP-binding protein [Burkholderiales bacterium]